MCVPVFCGPGWSRLGEWWQQHEPPGSSILQSAAAWNTSPCCDTETQNIIYSHGEFRIKRIQCNPEFSEVVPQPGTLPGRLVNTFFPPTFWILDALSWVVVGLTACLHHEQLMATISLLWNVNFCWNPCWWWKIWLAWGHFPHKTASERLNCSGTFPHCRHFPVWRLLWTQWCRTTLDWKTQKARYGYCFVGEMWCCEMCTAKKQTKKRISKGLLKHGWPLEWLEIQVPWMTACTWN